MLLANLLRDIDIQLISQEKFKKLNSIFHINRLYLQKADIAELVRWYFQFNWISQITFGDIEENIDIAVFIGNIEIEN